MTSQCVGNKFDERVLVAPASLVRDALNFKGFSADALDKFDSVLDSNELTFMRRGDAEVDPNFIQLVPYVLVVCETGAEPLVFAYRRGAGQGERRLASKWSVGVGGHVNDVDADAREKNVGRAALEKGVRREINEEIIVEAGELDFKPVGLVYDPDTEVGRVHLGIVYKLCLDAPTAWHNEAAIENAEFRPVSKALEEIDADHERFESWSVLALNGLYRAAARTKGARTLYTDKTALRVDGRRWDQTRAIKFQRGFTNAAGSVLAAAGDTVALCVASVVEDVPEWMKRGDVAPNRGWITAEYRMLPSSVKVRKPRQDRPDGRATEIQRLIGRSLRAVFDAEALGPRTIYLDCDVLQADGGTRTLCVSGACVALIDALNSIRDRLPDPNRYPIRDAVSAVSVGLINGVAALDLNYVEDSAADVDMNVVTTAGGRFVEIQGTGEEQTFDDSQLAEMLSLAKKGTSEIAALQRAVLADAWPFK